MRKHNLARVAIYAANQRAREEAMARKTVVKHSSYNECLVMAARIDQGRCACCGRRLTVSKGIGPVCGAGECQCANC